MKRVALAITILAMGAAGCGSSNSNPNNPSPNNIVVYTVQLSSQNENPPITNAESTARGTAVITIHTDTNMIDFNVSLNGFTPTSAVNIAHIHGPNAPAGINASVFISTGLTPGNVGLVNGAGTFSLNSVQATAAQVQQITSSPQTFYFNVHTTLNGGGAVRGQLQ